MVEHAARSFPAGVETADPPPQQGAQIKKRSGNPKMKTIQEFIIGIALYLLCH
jgi:hypothetical protein